MEELQLDEERDFHEGNWERLGGKELEQPLRDGLVKCLDSDYLVKLHEEGRKLKRMQDLDETAFIGLERLKGLGTCKKEIFESTLTTYEWLPVAILSYAWLEKDHPDPEGETLRVLATALKVMGPYGVIIDFASLPQEPRKTEQERNIFKEGLQKFNVFYSHPHTLVLQVKAFPKGYPHRYRNKHGHEPRPYDERGWCFAESCISSLGKTPKLLCNLSRLPKNPDGVVGRCVNEEVLPLLTPEVFNGKLEQKTFTQKTTDLGRVKHLYEEAFNTRIRDAENLMFADVGWRDREIKALSEALEKAARPSQLDLTRNRVGNGLMPLLQVMESHPTLMSLKLVDCELGDPEAHVIGQALSISGTPNSLTSLDISHNRIGAEGARHLAEALMVNRTLTTLELWANRIGAEGAASLAEGLKVNSTLAFLKLWANNIRDEGAQSIAEALKVNSTSGLTFLNLMHNHIGDRGAGCLAEALTVNTTLRELYLGYNEIGGEGAGCLAEALKVNTALTGLHFSDNRIGGQGGRCLGEALKVNTTLISLGLRNNDLGVEGAEALAEGLKVNRTLTQLRLWNNRIGDPGAQSLAEALKVNTTLTELGLADNRIHDAGAVSLAAALKVNPTLAELKLRGNPIKIEGALSLAASLRVNTTLTKLQLDGNKIKDEGRHALEKAQKDNAALAKVDLDLWGKELGEEGAQSPEARRVSTTLSELHRRGDQLVATARQGCSPFFC